MKNQGVIAGLFGCIFGILGIFTIGIIFVPLAALCSLIGLLRGMGGPSGSGIGISLLGGVLTFWGYTLSPSLLLMTGGLLLASHSPVSPPRVVQPQPQIVQPQIQPAPIVNTDPVKLAGQQSAAAINECRARRLGGELKNFLESARCSNPRILQAFSAAHYKYMDLIGFYTAQRAVIAEEIDRNEITEAQGQAANTKLYSRIVDLERERDRARK